VGIVRVYLSMYTSERVYMVRECLSVYEYTRGDYEHSVASSKFNVREDEPSLNSRIAVY
jgi:hypothetical protein